MKLYWRVKINGKWTWRPAKVLTIHGNEDDGKQWNSYEVAEFEEEE